MEWGTGPEIKRKKSTSQLSGLESRRQFILGLGKASLLITAGGWSITEMFKKIFGAQKQATPLPVSEGNSSIQPAQLPNGEPDVIVLDKQSQDKTESQRLHELASKKPLSRQDLMEYLQISEDPVTQYVDTEIAHVFSPTALQEAFLYNRIVNEKDPVKKMLMAILYSGIEGNRQEDERSPAIWANQFNPSKTDGNRYTNKCNSYAQFISQAVTMEVDDDHENIIKIGHIMDDASGNPIPITPDNIRQVYENTGINRPYTEYSARNIRMWLESEVGGQRLGWKKVAAPDSNRLYGNILYVVKYDENNSEDGHNFIVFLDKEGGRYITQSTYNTMLQPLSDETWKRMFSEPEYHVFSHNIIP